MDNLKLDQQHCFPLYAASKKVTKQYRPILDEVGLTYTQYLVMMVLWEDHQVSLSHIGDRLFLDSGTLTPVVKKLESKSLLNRVHNNVDERGILITLTQAGIDLKDRCEDIPMKIRNCIDLEDEDLLMLQKLLYKILK